jgi:hypothetical protein
VISLQKVDSMLVVLNVQESNRGFLRTMVQRDSRRKTFKDWHPYIDHNNKPILFTTFEVQKKLKILYGAEVLFKTTTSNNITHTLSR